VFANDAPPGPLWERACKLIEMDGMQIHRRRRRMQFILVLCGLAILFGLDYLLLIHSIPG
jgi:hypothetical protein